METGRPSRTAQRVAVRRAAHQLLDRPLILHDPFALRIVGPDAAAATRARADERSSRAFRAFVSVRSRIAEGELARAVAAGVRQYVLLGAGLDTFAWRNPWAELGLRVFEVDFPATQRWKRQRVENVGMGVPESLVFAPVDFERQTLAEGLAEAGFQPGQPAVFAWLGVVPYLTLEAFRASAAFIGSLPAGSALVFDYTADPSQLPPPERLALAKLESKVAAMGEPFRLFFTSAKIEEEMRSMGFRQMEDLGSPEINERYFGGRDDKLRVVGGFARIVRAWVTAL